jgi:hypothetical protein
MVGDPSSILARAPEWNAGTGGPRGADYERGLPASGRRPLDGGRESDGNGRSGLVVFDLGAQCHHYGRPRLRGRRATI